MCEPLQCFLVIGGIAFIVIGIPMIIAIWDLWFRDRSNDFNEY